MNYYRVWMKRKRNKDAIRPDYFVDTVAISASKAALDVEALTGDYADVAIQKIIPGKIQKFFK